LVDVKAPQTKALTRAVLESHVAKLNAARREAEAIVIESYDEAGVGAFVLSFPDMQKGEGECLDQDFTLIQWALFEHEDISTSIIGGERNDADERYHMRYEAVDWDA